MRIPLIDLKRQYKVVKNEINDALRDVMDSQSFILGNKVLDFESAIASYCKTKYAIGVNSGTDALILSLKALGIGEGDEVITTPFTFFATAEAVTLVGARPVFVDIEPKTYNINPSLIEEKINNSTKAIIPVHLYGQCADMDPIVEISKKYNLKIIEDCAQAIGSSYKNRPAGSMSDIATLSFYPSKNLGAFGDAGMIITNDKELNDKARLLRSHGSDVNYIHNMIGINSRLDNLQAAILKIKLKYLDKWLESRRKIAAYYKEKFKGLPLDVPYVPDYNVHTYHLYVIRVHKDIRELIKSLLEKGIETRTYYPVPLHMQECYKNLGYKKGNFPEAEKASNETLAIPLFPEITEEEKDYVIKCIKDFFRK